MTDKKLARTMSASLPTLETARLLLRPPAPEDFDAWAEFCADAEAQRFLGGALDRASAWRNICVAAGAWTVRGFSFFSVIEKASGRWIGRVGPWQPEGWAGAGGAHGFGKQAGGKGYAQEGAGPPLARGVHPLRWAG